MLFWVRSRAVSSSGFFCAAETGQPATSGFINLTTLHTMNTPPSAAEDEVIARNVGYFTLVLGLAILTLSSLAS